MHTRSPLDPETLNALLESFPCPALIVDPNRRVRAANDALRQGRGKQNARWWELVLRGPPRAGAERARRGGADLPARGMRADRERSSPPSTPTPPGWGTRILLRPIRRRRRGDRGVPGDAARRGHRARALRGPRNSRGASGSPSGRSQVRSPASGNSRLPVLVLGEPGTGRSLVARALHRQQPSPGSVRGAERSRAHPGGPKQSLWVRGRGLERAEGQRFTFCDVHSWGRRVAGRPRRAPVGRHGPAAPLAAGLEHRPGPPSPGRGRPVSLGPPLAPGGSEAAPASSPRALG